MIYGEFNTFKKQDAEIILQKIRNALNPEGFILLDPHLFDAIKQEGLLLDYKKSLQKGLFSDYPHEYFVQYYWDSNECISTRCIQIKETNTNIIKKNYSSMQAYKEQDYNQLMSNFGFCKIKKFPTLTGEKNKIHEGLFVLVANK